MEPSYPTLKEHLKPPSRNMYEDTHMAIIRGPIRAVFSTNVSQKPML
jgi:hypothetical protein